MYPKQAEEILTLGCFETCNHWQIQFKLALSEAVQELKDLKNSILIIKYISGHGWSPFHFYDHISALPQRWCPLSSCT